MRELHPVSYNLNASNFKPVFAKLYKTTPHTIPAKIRVKPNNIGYRPHRAKIMKRLPYEKYSVTYEIPALPDRVYLQLLYGVGNCIHLVIYIKWNVFVRRQLIPMLLNKRLYLILHAVE